MNNPQSSFMVNGKGSDMKFGISAWLEDQSNDLRVLFIDIPRSTSGYISWGAIEEIKNGMFFSGKYESKMCVFNSPHIFIFMNEEPDDEVFSRDRWRITEIGDRHMNGFGGGGGGGVDED